MAKGEKDQVKEPKPLSKKEQAAVDRQKRIESMRQIAKGDW